MNEKLTLSVNNLYQVRNRIISLLKGKRYTTKVNHTLYGLEIRSEQCLDRENDGVYAFQLSFTEIPEGSIQIADSWGCYSIKTPDVITFGENFLIVEGVCSSGHKKHWTFIVE
jgi:hypothetical protein